MFHYEIQTHLWTQLFRMDIQQITSSAVTVHQPFPTDTGDKCIQSHCTKILFVLKSKLIPYLSIRTDLSARPLQLLKEDNLGYHNTDDTGCFLFNVLAERRACGHLMGTVARGHQQSLPACCWGLCGWHQDMTFKWHYASLGQFPTFMLRLMWNMHSDSVSTELSLQTRLRSSR